MENSYQTSHKENLVKADLKADVRSDYEQEDMLYDRVAEDTICFLGILGRGKLFNAWSRCLSY